MPTPRRGKRSGNNYETPNLPISQSPISNLQSPPPNLQSSIFNLQSLIFNLQSPPSPPPRRR
ncbi:MAG: hypothetical protein D6790_06225 [Caldilineae bacterium]|nr:MAG: hypothetical protein D6790_06225 [Caldilineae bacterium]